MYRLYDMNLVKFIKDYDSEYKLIKGIESIIKENSRFLVITNKNNGDETFLGIRSIKDFEIYKADFNRRMIINKSCVELKKEILEIDEKRKKR